MTNNQPTTMNDISPCSDAESSSAISSVACTIYHRDGGYLCLDPRSAMKNGATVAFNKDIIPYKKFIIVPNQDNICPDTDARVASSRLGTKQEFFNVMGQLIGKEVAIMDLTQKKYLTKKSGFGAIKPSKTDTIYKSEFKDEPHFFYLNRTDTGAYTFYDSDKQLYLHKSSKVISQDMKASSHKIESINICPVTLSSKDDKESNANDWIIEPDIMLEHRQNCHGSILFLGVVDNNVKSTQKCSIQVSYHFGDVATAWRTQEQWDETMYSMKCQLLVGSNDGICQPYCVEKDFTGSKAKWIASCTPDGEKLCVVIASNSFHQELSEQCVGAMKGMVATDDEGGSPIKKDLHELGLEIQMKEVALLTAKSTKLSEETSCDLVAALINLQDVPMSLLHRSGAWLSIDQEGHDLLYIEPLEGEIVDQPQQQECTSDDLARDQEYIRTTGDYFKELKKYQKVALRNEKGQYIFCKEPKNAVGMDKRDWSGKKYLVAGYRHLESEEKPDAFIFEQNDITGAHSIKSASNGLFLNRNEKGVFVFTASKENEGDLWFIDAVDLQSGATSEDAQLLFAGVIKQDEENIIVSQHAPGRPTAWRTEGSFSVMINELVKDIEVESSTVVTDSDTGYQWFATTPDGKKLFLVIATEGFPWLYGFKAAMAVEYTYQEKGESPDELYRCMRTIETECRYTLEYGNEEICCLINCVDEMKEILGANILEAQKKTASLEEMKKKVEEINEMAEQFHKKGKSLPKGKSKKVAAGTAVGGVIIGGVAIGISCVTPAAAPIAGTVALSAAEVVISAVSAFGGAAMGGLFGAYSAGMFSKRPFINFGRCINSRIQKRSREKRIGKVRKEKTKTEENIERVKAGIGGSFAFESVRAFKKTQRMMAKTARTEHKENVSPQSF